jgi:hypothetical protein
MQASMELKTGLEMPSAQAEAFCMMTTTNLPSEAMRHEAEVGLRDISSTAYRERGGLCVTG